MSSLVAGLPYAMHSTPVFRSADTRHLPFMDRLDEELQVLERRRRMDAVTEVENVTRPAARASQHVARSLAYQLGRPQQHGRVEVALDAAVVTDDRPPCIQWDAPVERDYVRAGRGYRLEQTGRVGAEVDPWYVERRQLAEQRARVRQDPGVVVLARQRTHPRVENLDRRRARRHLRPQICGHRRGQLGEQPLERRRLRVHERLDLEEVAA